MKIGIIGLGYWGPNYARVLNEIKGVDIKYVCDKDKSKLSEITSKYPNITHTIDYEEVLNDSEVDAVIIATPSKTHHQIASKALKMGKHVLVEKPLATSAVEAKELIEMSKGKVLMVGHIFEFNSAVRQIKKYLDEKELGGMVYIHSSRTGLGPIRHDVNAIWDLASHDISILIYLIGKEPINVLAKGKSHIQKGIEDLAFIILEFPGDIIANVHVSWLDPVKTRKMTIVGTKKMLVFDDVSQSEKIKIFDKGVSYEKPGGTFGDFQLLVRDGDILIPKVKFSEPLKDECLHFLECITNKKRPLTDGQNGLSVVRVLEAAQQSLVSGKTVQLK